MIQVHFANCAHFLIHNYTFMHHLIFCISIIASFITKIHLAQLFRIKNNVIKVYKFTKKSSRDYLICKITDRTKYFYKLLQSDVQLKCMQFIEDYTVYSTVLTWAEQRKNAVARRQHSTLCYAICSFFFRVCVRHSGPYCQ